MSYHIYSIVPPISCIWRHIIRDVNMSASEPETLDQRRKLDLGSYKTCQSHIIMSLMYYWSLTRVIVLFIHKLHYYMSIWNPPYRDLNKAQQQIFSTEKVSVIIFVTVPFSVPYVLAASHFVQCIAFALK